MLLALLAGAAAAPSGWTSEPATPPASKSVVDLQPAPLTRSIDVEDGAGRRGHATLIDLNPRIHAWLLLTLRWQGDALPESFHLENPGLEPVELDPSHPTGLVLRDEAGSPSVCALWAAGAADGLEAAQASRALYVPLCGERLYLRHEGRGSRTTKEWIADLLRDHVWGGEEITDLVRDTLFKDAWRESSPLSRDSEPEVRLRGEPRWPRLAPGYDDDLIDPIGLGIAVAREPGGKVGVGHWLPTRGNPGVFVSVVTPAAISSDVLAGVRHPVNPLDRVEAGALVYLIAFDLAGFELGYALGTEHPRVDWSDRVQSTVRDPSIPGPDGIGTIAPLVRTGMLSPAVQGRVAATFTGGFKRMHGAMRWGPLAQLDRGSHYGFVENGVVLSRLQPGLATVVVLDGGRVELETWRERDANELEHVRFARQNGVPLVEPDPETGRPEPGALVTQWGAGNWSGSEDKSLRTLRAGLCLQESAGHRFLVYGVFSSATPSAMATVFQGYGCAYAMLLDMNALEHTYLALYRHEGAKFVIEHLLQGMSELDKTAGAQTLPRFVGFPDNRDFFYLLRRSGT